MKDSDQIKAISELDGWEQREGPPSMWFFYRQNTFPKGANALYELPFYLTSRDAIVPAIEKQKELPNFGVRFTGIIDKIVKPNYLVDCICATPRQLSEALLRATGKWTE